MDAASAEQLDEQAAEALMGWVKGGPDQEFWMLSNPPPGLTSVFRMPVTRWRPTRDAFCLDLLIEEVRSRGMMLEIGESTSPGEPGFSCTIRSAASGPPVTASAPTAGMAVVCAALAHVRGQPG